MLAQPDTNSAPMETTIDIMATGTLRRAIFVLALWALWMLVAPGCSSPPERGERAVTLSVETLPPSAAVSVMAGGRGEKRALGASPVAIRDLKVVRKVYSSGAVDYWLADEGNRLPPNPGKPDYASPEYAAGNDYPLELTFFASSPGYEAGSTLLRIDRTALRRLFEEDPALGASIVLTPGSAPATCRGPDLTSDGPQASAAGAAPRMVPRE